MDLTAGRRLRAYLTDWDQDCCGSPLRVGEEGVVELAPAAPWVRDLGLGPVDAAMTMHDVGDDAAPPHRVRARLLRVQEVRFDSRASADGTGQEKVPGSAWLADVDGLPGRYDINADPGAGESSAGDPGPSIGTVTYGASYQAPPGWVSGPDGWLLDLEVLEELGPAW